MQRKQKVKLYIDTLDHVTRRQTQTFKWNRFGFLQVEDLLMAAVWRFWVVKPIGDLQKKVTQVEVGQQVSISLAWSHA